MYHVVSQHWMLILGVLCCFYAPEMSYKWPVQPPGIVPLGRAVAAWGRLQTAAIVLRSGLALRVGNFGPVADGCKVSKTQAVKVISEVFGQEITRDVYSLSGPNEAVIKRNMILRKM